MQTSILPPAPPEAIERAHLAGVLARAILAVLDDARPYTRKETIGDRALYAALVAAADAVSAAGQSVPEEARILIALAIVSPHSPQTPALYRTTPYNRLSRKIRANVLLRIAAAND